MFNAKCLLILTLLTSVICFGCDEKTSQMMKPVVEELLVEEPVWIYWRSSQDIQRAASDGTNRQLLLNIRLDVLGQGIALDVEGGKMYWTLWGGSDRSKIQRANLDGSNVEDVVTGLPEPKTIALDTAGEKMYWTNTWGPGIQRANLDGSNVEIIVEEVANIGGLALDVANGKVYWGDTGVRGSKIHRANLDGSNVEDVITGLSKPDAIALDVANGRVYWSSSFTFQIQRANLDGSQVEELVSGLSEVNGIALDVASGKMYWSSGSQIQRANLDGSHVEDIIFTGTWVDSMALGISQPSGPGLGPVAEEVEVPRVSIPDANLATAIREEIGNSITRQTLLNLTRLEAPNRGITDLTGLEHAHNLKYLNLGDVYSEAERKWLNSNRISDLSPLAGLTQLTHLHLNDPNDRIISDITPLTNLTQLSTLYLAHNIISDITPLTNLTQLTELSLWNNSISDITPLAGLTQLTHLYLANNSISDITPLAGLTQLTQIWLLGNPLSYASINTHIPAMQTRGIEVEFDEPPVEEPERQFTPFEGLTISDDGTVSLIVGRAEMHAGPGRCIFFDNSSLNGIRYDVHDFFWAYRADDNSDFRAIEGTESDQGICGYKALTDPGQYRVFLDFSMNGNRHDAVSQNVIEIK